MDDLLLTRIDRLEARLATMAGENHDLQELVDRRDLTIACKNALIGAQHELNKSLEARLKILEKETQP
jgi:hypothetical protein